jgi:hypothetical protein
MASSSNNSLGVLVEAKKEYLNQLYNVMCPQMIQTFQELFNSAVKEARGKPVLKIFQKKLQETIPKWNNEIINTNVKNLTDSCSWFGDIVAAVFVSYVKILSSVKLKSVRAKLSITMPQNDVFVQSCYKMAAEDIYRSPFVFAEDMSEYERDRILTDRISVCIEKVIRNMIPVKHILESCMSGTEYNEGGDEEEAEQEEEIDEDPIEQEDSGEPEPVPPEQEVPSLVHDLMSPPEEESKTIPVNMEPPPEQAPQAPSPADDDVLFPNAPERKT